MMVDAAPPPAPPPAIACETRIIDYRRWREVPGQDWHFAGTAANGAALSLFGAQHLRDPAAPQFAAIDAAFAAARPTLVYFEGPDRGLAATREAAIRGGGESGYLRFLAHAAGIPARSLEPSPPEQIAALKDRFPADRIMLFFVLREAARLRDREGKAGEALDAAVATLLARTAPLAEKLALDTRVRDLPSLAAAARREWPGRDWRTFPAGWFAPGKGVAEARFLPAINTAVSGDRDRHLYALLAKATAGGERTFVVVGRNHVPVLAPALRCLLGPGA